ncbi:hypothetical protein [Staphylococcus shinii]|uniref:hypothetical protein n=1 Tax=Staphylococcus shinii TaxID=2912228 RepID=UPI00298F1571|nr:hypothetical protein [Staphylococcus shinii]MDW8564699.1 hypothetical protein [Staphylococcus shinii]
MNQFTVKIIDVNGDLHSDLVNDNRGVKEVLTAYQSTINTLAFVKVGDKSIKTDKVVSLEVY